MKQKDIIPGREYVNNHPDLLALQKNFEEIRGIKLKFIGATYNGGEAMLWNFFNQKELTEYYFNYTWVGFKPRITDFTKIP